MLSDNLGPRALCISSIISRKLAVQRLFITRASTRTVKCAFFFGTEEDFTFRRGGEVKQSCIPHLVVQCDSRHRKCVLDISLSLLHSIPWTHHCVHVGIRSQHEARSDALASSPSETSPLVSR